MEQIPAPSPGTYLHPLAWSPDGRSLFGAIFDAKTNASVGLAVYDALSKKVSPIPGVSTTGWAFRGSALGAKLAYTDNDGVHIVDPGSGSDRLLISGTGRLGSIACHGTACYIVQANDNADIWLRTAGTGAAAPAESR
jgi:hypothetical protein